MRVTDAGASVDQSATRQSVSIKFRAKIGSADFACGQTYPGVGATNTTVTPQDFRFFVQDVKLVDASGDQVSVTLDDRSPWQTKDVALIDFEDGTGSCTNGNAQTNDVITGTVPAGAYTGIVFTNGVPEALDHADPATAPDPLQAGGMTWGWLYGYKFIRLELASTTPPASNGGVAGVGIFHIGSVDCANDSDAGTDDAPVAVVCGQQNRNQITLTGYDPSTSTIVIDAAQIFAVSDLDASTQCHSDDAALCGPMFSSVGVKFVDGSRLPGQSAYRVE